MHHQAPSPTKLCPFLWQRAPEEIRAPIDAESAYEDIESWILTCIAFRLGVDPLDLDPRESPRCYGFTGEMATQLSRDLVRWLGRILPSDLFRESVNVSDVARSLARGRSLAGEASTALVRATAAFEAPARRPSEAARRPRRATPSALRERLADLPDPDFGGRASGSFPERRAAASGGVAS